jgi:ethanolamine kinase
MFGNGRVEEFLYCKTLAPQEMCSPHFIPLIAQLLQKFHGASIDLPRTPTLWQVIGQWLATAKSLQFEDPQKAASYAELDFKVMEVEIQEVKAVCDATCSPLVFGHNDLLSGNLLVLQPKGFDPTDSSRNADDNGPLTVIDFEYGAYTYRGYDIANHFCEYAGFECDYTRWGQQRTAGQNHVRPPSVD